LSRRAIGVLVHTSRVRRRAKLKKLLAEKLLDIAVLKEFVSKALLQWMTKESTTPRSSTPGSLGRTGRTKATS
jgi:hypothetical protein